MVIKPGHQNTFVCPRCNRLFKVAIGTSDFVHECDSGNPTLDNEDVPVIGQWQDYTGSGGVPPTHLSTAGIAHKNMGTKERVFRGLALTRYALMFLDL